MHISPQSVARNMNIKADSGKITHENKENIIGHWRKYYLCYKLEETCLNSDLMFIGEK